jgi:hypothetical protein
MAIRDVRGIVLISVYGALFSGIALLRKNLFPGMLKRIVGMTSLLAWRWLDSFSHIFSITFRHHGKSAIDVPWSRLGIGRISLPRGRHRLIEGQLKFVKI